MKRPMLLLAFAAMALSSKAEPLWMRYPAISPNGEQVAFTYKGNIYVVSSQGGQAKRITPTAGYNFNPVWSPDSKTLAYANDRYGNFDVFTISASGGTPTRVTTNSAKEVPYAFSNDGNTIYFGATIADPAQSALFPKGSMEELYAVPVKGGRYEQVLATPAQFISFSEDGKTFLYQDRKGGENEWRKHHTSSITRDIWLYDTATGKHTQQTQWEGENRNPHFAKDGKSFYYLSEQGGTFNVWQMPIGKASEAKQVTSFKTHPVRFLSAADNGMLCFGYNGEIYTMQEKQQPEKLGIEIVSDDPTGKNNYFSVSSGSYGTVSPDGKMIATVSRGELFVTAVDYPTTKRITQTAQSEVAPTFAADNRTIAYASERDGNWNIYTATVVRKDEPNLAYATLIEEKPLFKDNRIDRSYPQYSPDGKELAFVEGRCRLMVLDIKSGKVRQITDGSKHYSTTGYMDYSWSPDGKWFAVSYTGNQHDPYSDIGIVSAKGGEIHNLTNTGYFDESPQWVMGGNAIVFSTDRFGMRSHASWGSQNDIMIVYLNRKSYELARMSKEDYELYKEAEKKAKEEKEKAEKEKAEKEKGKNKDKKADESKKPDEKKTEDIVVELDNIEERIVRLTSRSGSLSGFSMNKEGDKLFYMMSYDGSYDMWQLDLRDRSNKIIFNDVSGSLQWDKKMENMFIFGSKTGKYKGGNGAYTGISIRGEMNMDLAAEREYMFDRIYRQEKERFYHVDMHGVDWNAMRDNYARFLPHINNNFDFAEMASEWLGELNVSHTGCSFSPSYDGNSDITADLGLFYDAAHKGNGLKVSEIIVGGPFDKATSQLKKGDIIEKINGTEICEGMDYYPLLNRLSGKRTLISIYRPADKKRWEEVVKPVSRGSLSDQLYKRWVKQRAADVERLSGGRLGYVHIESMGDASFRTIYADILGKYNHCDGIVIDTRFNGGGRLHEDIEILFSGEKYLTQVVRGKDACDMPSRRYNKPSIMITCEANYSNAHGTPWVYQHRGIGKVVGMPVPGTMTSVTWERLQDASLVFGIPVIGYRTADGSYLENKQLEPDIKVANSPELIVTGRDEQLETAVKALLEQIDAEKKQKK